MTKHIAKSALVHFLLYSETGGVVGAQVLSMGSSIEGLKAASDDVLRDVEIDPDDVEWELHGSEFTEDGDKDLYRRYTIDGTTITHVITHSFMAGAQALPG